MTVLHDSPPRFGQEKMNTKNQKPVFMIDLQYTRSMCVLRSVHGLFNFHSGSAKCGLSPLLVNRTTLYYLSFSCHVARPRSWVRRKFRCAVLRILRAKPTTVRVVYDLSSGGFAQISGNKAPSVRLE